MPLPSKADLQRVLDLIAANEYDPASAEASLLGSVLPLVCYPLIPPGPAAASRDPAAGRCELDEASTSSFIVTTDRRST